jgi:hypothetical protein
MKEADLEADRLMLRSLAGKLLVERRAASDPGIAQVRNAQGQTDLLLTASGPGVWRGEMAVATPGLHQVTSGDKQGFIIAGIGNPNEARLLKADGSSVSKAQAKAGGGALAWLGRDGRGALPAISRIGANANGGGDSFGLRQTGASAVIATRRDPLVPTWIFAILMVGFSLFGWLREGR